MVSRHLLFGDRANFMSTALICKIQDPLKPSHKDCLVATAVSSQLGPFRASVFLLVFLPSLSLALCVAEDRLPSTRT